MCIFHQDDNEGVERVLGFFRERAEAHRCGTLEVLQDCEGTIIQAYGPQDQGSSSASQYRPNCAEALGAHP